MAKTTRLVLFGLLAMVGIFAGRSEAEVIINSTRVVYPSSDKEVTMQLTNKGSHPALVQVWLDDYSAAETSPDQVKVPFTVTPPLFRIEAQKGQAVRLLYTQQPLPADKESLFRINVLEVPPRPQASEGENLLQFAVRTRIKLIFRPKGLTAGGAFEAPRQLQWTLHVGGDGKTPALRVSNPTPYYVNFANVSARIGEEQIRGPGGMVAPGSTADFPIKELTGHTSAEIKAQFVVISDLGANVPYVQPLSP
jgi:chaperone protein EcpD